MMINKLLVQILLVYFSLLIASGEEFENHGSVICYFHLKQGISSSTQLKPIIHYGGSGTRLSQKVFLTAAHNLYFIGKDETEIEHLRHYEPFPRQIEFYTFNKTKILCDEFCLSRNYREHAATSKNQNEYDYAILYSSSSNDAFSHSYSFCYTQQMPHPINIRMTGYNHSYLDEASSSFNHNYFRIESNANVNRYKYGEELPNDHFVEYIVDLPVNAHMEGFSGATVHFLDTPENIVAIHTANYVRKTKNKSSSLFGIFGSNESEQTTIIGLGVKTRPYFNVQIHTLHDLLLKRMIWQKLNFDFINPSVDRWRPVLLSVQADREYLLQSKFLELLKKNLGFIGHSKEKIKEKILELFQFFALSGYGRSIMVMNFDEDLLLHSTVDDETETYRDLNLSEHSKSKDMTLEGIDKLQEKYDEPLFVVALGVTTNSEEVDSEIWDYVIKNNFLYKRIDYLQHPDENDQDYDERIIQETQRITELLVRNASLNPTRAEEKKEEDLTIADITLLSITSPEEISPAAQELAQNLENS